MPNTNSGFWVLCQALHFKYDFSFNQEIAIYRYSE